MARERTVKLTILGDASSMRRTFGQVNGMTSRMGRSFASLGRAVGRVAVVGFGALAAGIGFAAKEAAEAQKVTAKTRAVIKSTGQVANVTAKQVKGLAGRIMGYSGQSDEAVQSMENVLLTFKNVKNEVGDGNKVFTEATKRIVDMSVALDKDLQSSAIMVGKALNDPIAGITAMTRAGVQFTDAQKEQIAALVESGDLLSAQKIILKELESQFGGTARAVGKTAAGQFAILKEQIGNVAERIGKRLLPVLRDAMTWFSDNLPAIVGTARVLFRKLAGFVGDVKDAFLDWGAALDRWFGGTGNGQAIIGFFQSFANELKINGRAAVETGRILVDGLVGAFQELRSKIAPILDWVNDRIKSLQDALNAFFGDPILQTVIAGTASDLIRDVLNQTNQIRQDRAVPDGSQGSRPPTAPTPNPPSGSGGGRGGGGGKGGGNDNPDVGTGVSLRAQTQPVIVIQGDVYGLEDLEGKLRIVRERRGRRFDPAF